MDTIALDQMPEDDTPLTDLPRHLQMAILEKFEFPDFVLFKQCSNQALKLADLVKSKIPWHVYELKSLDFQALHENLKTTDNLLEIVQIDIFQLFIHATKAKSLLLWSPDLSNEIFNQSYIQQMEELFYFFGAHHPEEDFTMLNAVKIDLAVLPNTPETLQRLQKIFQQWATGARRINFFEALWLGSKEEFVAFTLRDLRLKRIWSPNTHRRTPLARMKLWRHTVSPGGEAFICFGENDFPLLIQIVNYTIRAREVEDELDAYRKLYYYLKGCPLNRKGTMLRRFGNFFRRVFRL